MMIGFFEMFWLRYKMACMRTIYPIPIPKFTETNHKTINMVSWRTLLNWGKVSRVSLCFGLSDAKSYGKSYIDKDVFKLLCRSLLLQWSKIMASAIGTTLFAYGKFSFLLYNANSIVVHYCQRFFNLSTWTNTCWVILESAIGSFMYRIGIFFILRFNLKWNQK